MSDQIAAIAIGRNEGERLRRCLHSLVGRVEIVIYVDSGSTDGSVEFGRDLGVEVVELDMSRPFTAARARNAGFERLQTLRPHTDFVFFIDGDCEMRHGWLSAAMEKFDQDSRIAIVCGNLSERYSEASIYNRLAQLEWQGEPGEQDACGGIFVIRADAFHEVGGFNDTVIAAEDDELCVRLRQAGWKIHRIDTDMAWHDADMQRFGQWWKRAVRAGHAFAQGYVMHGRPPERHFAWELRRCLLWGFVLPVFVVALAWPTYGVSAILLLGYGISTWRAYGTRRRLGDCNADARLYAIFTLPAKFAGAQGALLYAYRRLLKRDPRLIEYK